MSALVNPEGDKRSGAVFAPAAADMGAFQKLPMRPMLRLTRLILDAGKAQVCAWWQSRLAAH